MADDQEDKQDEVEREPEAGTEAEPAQADKGDRDNKEDTEEKQDTEEKKEDTEEKKEDMEKKKDTKPVDGEDKPKEKDPEAEQEKKKEKKKHKKSKKENKMDDENMEKPSGAETPAKSEEATGKDEEKTESEKGSEEEREKKKKEKKKKKHGDTGESETKNGENASEEKDKQSKKKDKKKKKRKEDKERSEESASKEASKQSKNSTKINRRSNRKPTARNIPLLSDEHYQKVVNLAQMFARVSTMAREHNMKISKTNDILSKVEGALTTLETTQNTYQFIWKIKNFQEHLDDAKTGKQNAIYCPGVESHHYGYKIGITLCPNGDGIGRNTHMSLFFCLLKGKYDDMLPWPFSCSLRFSLLDQKPPSKNKRRDNIVGIFTPNPTPVNERFLGQPTAVRNPGLGLPRFASLQAIFAEENKYIADDTIFIKIEVDLNGLETRMDD